MRINITFCLRNLVTSAFALCFCVSVHAASNGAISFDGTGNAGASTCNNASLDYHYSFTANTNDSDGDDYVAIVMVDASGSPLDVDFVHDTTPGTYNETDYTDFGSINSIAARPVTIAIFDIGDPGAIDENTVAGYNLAIAGTLLAQTSIDPATVASACSTLPLSSAYSFAPSANASPTPALGKTGMALLSLLLAGLALLGWRRRFN